MDRPDRRAAEGSVHLQDWPDPAGLPADPARRHHGPCPRGVLGRLSVRKAQGLRVRLPLASLRVAAPDAASLAPFAELITDEVNVRELSLTDDVDSAGRWVLALVPWVLGPRLGAGSSPTPAAVRAGEWTQEADGSVSVLAAPAADEYELRLVAADEAVSRALGGPVGDRAGHHAEPGAGGRGHRPGRDPRGAERPEAGRPARQRSDRARRGDHPGSSTPSPPTPTG